jgi:steroid delta-isomerase-like uncharacterized protein
VEPTRHDVVRELRAHVAAETAQDLDALLQGMTGDCYNVVVGAPDRAYRGPEEVAERYRAMWSAVPDLVVTLRRVVAVDGHDAVTEHTLSGTHVGRLFDVPGTGGQIEVKTVVLWELRDGRIHGEMVYVDFASLLQQAELVPRRADAIP